MINEQLSFEDYKIKILKENVYWDDSLSYSRWYDKHHNNI